MSASFERRRTPRSRRERIRMKRSSLRVSDLETTAIAEPLAATVRLLCKVTREHAVNADDMRAVLASGALARADRGCARRLLLVQHDRSVGRCFQLLRVRSQGLRGWREVPARARLPLTNVGSRDASTTGGREKLCPLPPNPQRTWRERMA